MGDQEFIIALVAITFGIGLSAFLFWNVFSLIKAWINRKSHSAASELNPQFFKALREFKKSTERRITNLEAIIADLEEEQIRVPETDSFSGKIEIEDKEVRSKENDNYGGNLRNMLNE